MLLSSLLILVLTLFTWLWHRSALLWANTYPWCSKLCTSELGEHHLAHSPFWLLFGQASSHFDRLLKWTSCCSSYTHLLINKIRRSYFGTSLCRNLINELLNFLSLDVDILESLNIRKYKVLILKIMLILEVISILAGHLTGLPHLFFARDVIESILGVIFGATLLRRPLTMESVANHNVTGVSYTLLSCLALLPHTLHTSLNPFLFHFSYTRNVCMLTTSGGHMVRLAEFNDIIVFKIVSWSYLIQRLQLAVGHCHCPFTRWDSCLLGR